MGMDSMMELFSPMVDIVFIEKDEGETIPYILNAVEKMIVGKYVLGEKITLADLLIFDLLANCLSNFEKYGFKSSNWPKLEAIVSAVKHEPKISAYLAK